MSRFELARIIGMRALQLSEGAQSVVHVDDEVLRIDFYYVAALELYEGSLDAKLCTSRGAACHVRELVLPIELNILLDTRDGKSRPYRPSFPSSDSSSDSLTLP